MKKLATGLFLATGLVVGAAAPAVAATYIPVVTVAGVGNNLGNGPFTLGYEFSTSSTFSVGALGVYDEGNDGLISAHDVGLWNNLGTLLATTTVQAGTLSALSGGFRYETVTPFSIGPGTYRVGALFLDGSDPNFFGGDGILSSIAGVTYSSGAYAGGGALADPTSTGGPSPSYIGGNLLLATAAVPEPATWAMMIGGFGLIGGSMRRRKNTSVRFA